MSDTQPKLERPVGLSKFQPLSFIILSKIHHRPFHFILQDSSIIESFFIMWNYSSYLFIIVSSVMLSIFILQQNKYVITFLLLVWIIETPASFPLMAGMKKNIEYFSAIPFIKYGIKWVLLAVLQELTPPGKWLFLKLFSAIYITAVICKLKSCEGGAAINARRLIKFLVLHSGWLAYKCFTKGGLISGGLKIGGQDDIIASVIFLLPVLVGIVAVKGWDQVAIEVSVLSSVSICFISSYA
ncbi:hypothetical protein WN944_024151 [Citrus x changshan-huyou]|uniref:Uncharacterized protein n=1 Tax=Citrus x changshan-huyou TaxID=2935761 RepID=A0AAP0LMG3_9ROSI